MPIILTTREAEIKRIVAPGQPKETARPDPNKYLGEVVRACHSGDYRRGKIRGSWCRLAGQKARSYLQNNQSK
jgi:hypothetical protein